MGLGMNTEAETQGIVITLGSQEVAFPLSEVKTVTKEEVRSDVGGSEVGEGHPKAEN